MSVEVVEHKNIRYAEIIWASDVVKKTRFFSSVESPFQFGLLAHDVGYQEAPHFHQEIERTVKVLQQMFVVQRGVVGVQFFDDAGHMFKEIILKAGDAISLIHGAHAIRVIEDMQCISVKQGPFLGDALDKVLIEAKP